MKTPTEILLEGEKACDVELVKFLQERNLDTAFFYNRPVEEFDVHPYPEFRRFHDIFHSTLLAVLKAEVERVGEDEGLIDPRSNFLGDVIKISAINVERERIRQNLLETIEGIEKIK